MNNLVQVDKLFSGAFARAWEMTAAQLADNGVKIGAKVRNKDGDLFCVTTIEPRVHNFGAPSGSIVINGVKYRADRTWGTHEHWVGDIADLTVDE